MNRKRRNQDGQLMVSQFNIISDQKGMYMECTNQVKAHGRSEITKIIQSSTDSQHIVSVAHDGYLRVFNRFSFEKVQEMKQGSAYLTSLINYGTGYLLGNGKGELISVSSSLETQFRKKIHVDCLIEIIELKEHLVTFGSGGKTVFLDKDNFAVTHSIDLATPIRNATYSEGKIYVAGHVSYVIDIDTLNVTKMGRYDQIMVREGKVYACSDEKGFVVVDEDISTSFPCEFLLSWQEEIVLISEQSISFVQLGESIGSKTFRINCFRPGYAITTGLVIDNDIYLAGEEGIIYNLNWKREKESIETEDSIE